MQLEFVYEEWAMAAGGNVSCWVEREGRGRIEQWKARGMFHAILFTTDGRAVLLGKWRTYKMAERVLREELEKQEEQAGGGRPEGARLLPSSSLQPPASCLEDFDDDL